MASATGRERPPPARARSGQRVRHSRRHRRQGDRPGAARRVPRVDGLGSSAAPNVDPETVTPEPEVLRRRRRGQRRRERRRGRAPSQARASRRSTRPRARNDRDPLARARRPGREDGRAGARDGAARGGKSVQAFPEYGPERRGAPLRAFTRVADRPIRRHDSVTTPTWSSCSSRRSCTRRRSPKACPAGMIVFNGEEPPPELAGLLVRAFRPAARVEAGLGFVNIVMLGAVAAVLGEPKIEESRTRRSSCSARSSAPRRPRRAGGGARMAELTA